MKWKCKKKKDFHFVFHLIQFKEVVKCCLKFLFSLKIWFSKFTKNSLSMHLKFQLLSCDRVKHPWIDSQHSNTSMKDITVVCLTSSTKPPALPAVFSFKHPLCFSWLKLSLVWESCQRCSWSLLMHVYWCRLSFQETRNVNCVLQFPLQKHTIANWLWGVWQQLSSSDPCADCYDSYLYCACIASTIQICSLSFPTALVVIGANWRNKTDFWCHGLLFNQLTSISPTHPPMGTLLCDIFTPVQSCLIPGVQGQHSRCVPSRWPEPHLTTSPVFEHVHQRCPMLLLQLQALFVSVATKHQYFAHYPPIWVGFGNHGKHITYPVARAVSLNNFCDVLHLLTGLWFCRIHWDSLSVFKSYFLFFI